MRNLIMTLTFDLFVLLITACSESQQKMNIPQQASGDWRVYASEELVEH